MPRPSGVPPYRFLRWSAIAAIVTNVIIVFTGGIVRVTGSGLGCPEWPTCDGVAIAPTPGGDHAGWQAAIEFGNRLLTLPVLAAAIAVLIAIRLTRPHHRSTMALAWALPLGVLTQAVLGGITVLTQLSPFTVAAHFLVSMVLIAVSVILYERIRLPYATATTTTATGETERPVASRGVQHATTIILVVAAAVLLLGTAVTGAGPHGGDVDAARFALDIRLTAIAHADAVWLLIGVTVATVAVTWRRGSVRLRRALRLLLVVQLAQGGIGYTQYALGIPAELVSLHILGAAIMWAVACAAWARARPIPVPDAPELRDASESQDTAETSNRPIVP